MGQIKNIKLHIVTDIKYCTLQNLYTAMEEKYYHLKSRTTWTWELWFENTDCWDDSLIKGGVPPSASLIKKYDPQSIGKHHVCNVCEKTFRRQTELVRHL